MNAEELEELTESQLERQDWVDNAIYRMLLDVTERWESLPWDIDLIAEVRDAVQEALEYRNLIPENSSEFYPSISI